MQSTEDTDQIDYLISAGQAFRDQSDQYAELLTELADNLAAERNRADQAEARLAEVWEDGYWAANDDWNEAPERDVATANPYRAEATA